MTAKLFKCKSSISYLGHNAKMAQFFGAKVSPKQLKPYCVETGCCEERDGRSPRCVTHRKMRDKKRR